MRIQFIAALVLSSFLFDAAAENLCAPKVAEAAPQAGAPPYSVTKDGRWSLVWNDEFDVDGKVDATKWKNEINDEIMNQQKQYYTDREHPASRVNAGNLVIEARREDYKDRKYTSARLSTTHEWTYGRFEFRARLPSSKGTWPAIWMLGRKMVYGKTLWLDNGEIDIAEASSSHPNHIGQSLYSHSDNFWKGRKKIHSTHVPTADKQFHVYALEWLPGRLDFYIDGKKTYSDRKLPGETWMNWPFDQDFYIIINLAIGGSLGRNIDDSKLPAFFEVDYVRVYRPTRLEDCQEPFFSPTIQ